MSQTKVIVYHTERSMKRGIQRMERQGWRVISTQAVERGRGCIKGCIFGLFTFFLKAPRDYQVTFQREK